MNTTIIRTVVGLILMVGLVGCDTGFRQMGPSEFAVRFRSLPPSLGGGVDPDIITNGRKVVVWPWDSLYRFETSEQYVTWGQKGSGKKGGSDVLFTRARDGNEVALAVTVVYQIAQDPSRLANLVQSVATSNEEVRALVEAVGRADIRTAMNHLRTSHFADVEARYRAVAEVRDSMNRRLKAYGIDVLRVTLDDFRFERLLRDGSTDGSYQEKLTQIQKLREDTNREVARVETVRARKQKELNDVKATLNQQVAEADGYKNQAKIRADGYFAAKKNEAEAILAKGKADAEGLVKQVEALSGAGGDALIKLEIARRLIEANPKFIVVPHGSANGDLSVARTDFNQLLQQLGLIEASKESKPAAQ